MNLIEGARAAAASGAVPTSPIWERVAASGGVLGSLAASSCCLLPLALFGAGVTGAWIGNLTALAPYQPIFIAMTLGFVGVGSYLLYRRSRRACAEGAVCAPPLPNRSVKVALMVAAALLASNAVLTYVAPLFLSGAAM